MSIARLVFAGTLLCMSVVGVAQTSPATPWTGGGVFQNPSAATAGDAKSGASANTPGTDSSGSKSNFESRSNTARTPGDAKSVTPRADASAKKTFNESRSNALRTSGDAKSVVTPAVVPGNSNLKNTPK